MDRLTKPVRRLIIYWLVLFGGIAQLYMRIDATKHPWTPKLYILQILASALLIILWSRPESTKPNENPN